jgi:hypothetical protein
MGILLSAAPIKKDEIHGFGCSTNHLSVSCYESDLWPGSAEVDSENILR